MLYPSINEVKKKTDSRYTLCILAAKRSRDLIDGKPALVEIDNERPVSIAANEIADDLISYKTRAQLAEEQEAEAAAGEEAEAAEEAAAEAPEEAEAPAEEAPAEAE